MCDHIASTCSTLSTAPKLTLINKMLLSNVDKNQQ